MKRFFRYLLLTVLLLLLAVVGLTFLLEDRIGRVVLDRVNQEYGTTIEAQRFGLSLLRHFPAVGGELEGVRVAGAFGEPLLEAQTAGFRLPYGVLFGGEVALDNLYLEDCTLRVAFDERGRANYAIFPTSKGETTNEAARLGIQRARLENVRILYRHDQLRQAADLLVEAGEVKGDFGATDFILASNAEVRSNFIRSKNTRYLVDKALTYTTQLAVDTETGTYRLKDTRLAVEENAFFLDGTIAQLPDGTDFDIEFDSEEADLGKVLRLLPPPYTDYLTAIEGDGLFLLNGTVDGRLSATEQPAITVNMELTDGELGTGLFSTELSDIAFHATYTNGERRNARSSELTLSDFTGRLGDERIELDLAVRNFDDPHLTLSMNGAADIAPLQEFIDLPRLRGAGGVVEVRNLRVEGRYAHLRDPARIKRVDIDGILVADDLEVEYNGKTLGLPSGRLLLNGNRTELDHLQIRGEASDLTLRGTVDNLLPVLLADSLHTHRARLAFDLQADARTLDLDNLLHLADVSEEEVAEMTAKGASTEGVNTARRSRLIDLLRGSIRAQVANFGYELIEGEDFRGTVEFKDKHLLLAGDAAAQEGRYTLSGRLDYGAAPHLRAQVKGLGVDAFELFRQAENFGQSFIEADNLDGTLNAYTVVDAHWDKQGAFLYDQLLVRAGLGLENGSLKDFALLESFESYFKGGDLSEVQFRDLRGFFEIRRGEVRICKTQVASNAVDGLYVSGHHDFDQNFRYFIRVDASEVVLEKLFGRRRNREGRGGLGHMNYVVEGNVDNFDYETDRKRVLTNFATADNVQRRVIDELQRAFPEMRLRRGARPGADTAPPAERTREPLLAPADDADEEYIDFSLRPSGR